MFRPGLLACVLAMVLSVLSPIQVGAAVAPAISPLGYLREGLNAPSRIDVDGAGSLYVADSRAGAVLKYDKYSQFQRSFLVPLSGTGLAVTVDGSRIYVSGEAQVFVLDGASGAVVGTLGVGELTRPGEIDLDADGFIFVSDTIQRTVYVYDSTGVRRYVFGNSGNYAGQFRSMTALTVDTGSAEVMVADAVSVTSYKVVTGTVKRTLGNPQLTGTGTLFTQQLCPGDLIRLGSSTANPIYTVVAVVDDTHLTVSPAPIVTDTTARTIYRYASAALQVFDLAGSVKRSIPAVSGFGPKALSYFGGVAVDGQGRKYVLDYYSSEIRILGSAYEYLATYANPAVGDKVLNTPIDVAFDAGTSRLFVLNNSGVVSVFGIDGGQNPENANTAPGAPVALSPVGGSEVASALPELTWQAATDAEGDALTYEIEVTDTTGQVVAQLNNVSGTSVAVSTALTENARFRWTVRANDGEALSPWSEAQLFWVNALSEAPSAPLLDVPVAGTAVDAATVLSWRAATDADPFDNVSYRLQLSATADFAAPVIDVALAETSATLGALEGYSALVDGQDYFWRVLAVDNHDLATASEALAVVYDTTQLQLTANMPDARAYLGGNLAYAGQFVGVTPVELRDLAAGSYSVVVERAGFEPWVGRVTVGERENATVYAALRPAVAPTDLKARPLEAAGVKITRNADAVPFLVDYDNDGLVDLLTGEASGKLLLYRGVESLTPPAFAVGVELTTLAAGAAPFVADWNNDGRKDLVVGTGAGAVLLYLNVGSDAQPQFAAGQTLTADGAPIGVGASAVPAVIDLDGDGDKDLLVGAGSGVVVKYLNAGSDAAPVLTAAGPLLAPLSGNAAPSVADWNADGRTDVLLGTSQHLYVCLQQADRSFAPMAVLTVQDDLAGKNGKATSGAGYLGDRLRVFAWDGDGKKGKDLFVGTAAGEIKLARSNGRDFVAAFAGALADKLGQIETASEGDAAIAAGLASIDALLQAKDYVAAADQAAALAVGASVPVATLLDELVVILR